MVLSSAEAPGAAKAPPRGAGRRLSYAATFPDWRTRAAIAAVEWATGRVAIRRRAAAFDALGPVAARDFPAAALRVMGIGIATPAGQVARIPADGPVVIVANHPHGLVDGIVLADLAGRRRSDVRVLARSILTGIYDEATTFMIPVPFPHDPDAQAKSLAMRAAARDHLAAGGCLGIFPAGVVASAPDGWGPPVEQPWSVFTAQLIRRSGSTVVPIQFPGANSRAYQLAARYSPLLRQGLLLHEVVAAFDRPQAPVIGPAIPPDEIGPRIAADPRAAMDWLRGRTLALA